MPYNCDDLCPQYLNSTCQVFEYTSDASQWITYNYERSNFHNWTGSTSHLKYRCSINHSIMHRIVPRTSRSVAHRPPTAACENRSRCRISSSLFRRGSKAVAILDLYDRWCRTVSILYCGSLISFQTTPRVLIQILLLQYSFALLLIPDIDRYTLILPQLYNNRVTYKFSNK